MPSDSEPQKRLAAAPQGSGQPRPAFWPVVFGFLFACCWSITSLAIGCQGCSHYYGSLWLVVGGLRLAGWDSVSSWTTVHSPLINSSTRWRFTVTCGSVRSTSRTSCASLPPLESLCRLVSVRRKRGQPGRLCLAVSPPLSDSVPSRLTSTFLRAAPQRGQICVTEGSGNSYLQSPQKARTFAVIPVPRRPSAPRRGSG